MRLSILLSLVAATGCGMNYSVVPRSPWVGCYALERDGTDSPSALPASVELTSARAGRVPSSGGPDEPIDRPVLRALVGSEQGAWWSISNDSAVVIAGGRTGMVLYLGGDPDRVLAGSAEVLVENSDPSFPARRRIRTSIRATPVRC